MTFRQIRCSRHGRRRPFPDPSSVGPLAGRPPFVQKRARSALPLAPASGYLAGMAARAPSPVPVALVSTLLASSSLAFPPPVTPPPKAVQAGAWLEYGIAFDGPPWSSVVIRAGPAGAQLTQGGHLTWFADVTAPAQESFEVEVTWEDSSTTVLEFTVLVVEELEEEGPRVLTAHGFEAPKELLRGGSTISSPAAGEGAGESACPPGSATTADGSACTVGGSV